MTKTIAVLSTLDTKGPESAYLREEIEALGSKALLVDLGVVGEPGTQPDVSNTDVAAAGGTELSKLLREREVVVGLEVHAQLATGEKLFCTCANTFGAPPNSTISAENGRSSAPRISGPRSGADRCPSGRPCSPSTTPAAT